MYWKYLIYWEFTFGNLEGKFPNTINWNICEFTLWYINDIKVSNTKD